MEPVKASVTFSSKSEFKHSAGLVCLVKYDLLLIMRVHKKDELYFLLTYTCGTVECLGIYQSFEVLLKRIRYFIHCCVLKW